MQETLDSSMTIIRDTVASQVRQFMDGRLEQWRLEQVSKLNGERIELERERLLFEQMKSELFHNNNVSHGNGNGQGTIDDHMSSNDSKGKDKENNAIITSTLSFPSTIRLNVGGVQHTTLLDTLRSAPENSLLHLMFSGAFPLKTTDGVNNGCYFIDRNGKLFHYILDQLRNGFTILPKDTQQRRLILREARFYGVELMDESGKRSYSLDGEAYGDGDGDSGYRFVPDESYNVLNEVQTGGTARVIYIDGQSGSIVYNAGTLNGAVTTSWQNNGCLVNQIIPSQQSDDPYLSYRTNTATGTVWTNPTPGVSYGRLVIDLGRVCQFSRINVFSMRSDGQVTHVKISYLKPSGSKSSDDAISKSISDANGNVGLPGDRLAAHRWRTLVPTTLVTYGSDPMLHVVGNPTQFVIRPVSTRFLLVEATNDGQFGNTAYIEIRQLKAYNS